MAKPYVSSRRLAENAMAAMVAAIELYNKPQILYREQTVVVLVVNAWELLLKGILRKHRKNVFYRKERKRDYKSLTLDSTLSAISSHKLWPERIDSRAVEVNLKALSKYRNQTIHLYAESDLPKVLYGFLQSNITNFRDLFLEVFEKDLADQVTWTLLPLAPRVPNGLIEAMSIQDARDSAMSVREFLRFLTSLLEDCERDGTDITRVSAEQVVYLESVKKAESADLRVAIDATAPMSVIQKKTDPNITHPYRMNEVLRNVNNQAVRQRDLTSYDFVALVWKYQLRDKGEYAWQDRHSGSYSWSGRMIAFLKGVDEGSLEIARKEYREDLNRRPKAKVKLA